MRPGGSRCSSELTEAAEQAYQFSQRGQCRYPLLGLAPLERMLQAPNEVLSAWEPLLGDKDPWVRALARLQLGKMRIMLGQGGRDADAYLEKALAESLALGERFGIWFALTELADRIATRGDFAGACGHYEAAIAVITELGATDDVIRARKLRRNMIAESVLIVRSPLCSCGLIPADSGEMHVAGHDVRAGATSGQSWA